MPNGFGLNYTMYEILANTRVRLLLINCHKSSPLAIENFIVHNPQTPPKK